MSDKPIQEMIDNMFEGWKERLPMVFDGRIRENLKLEQNVDMEAKGTQAGHAFRFRLTQVIQSVRNLSFRKGTGVARERSESRYNSALRLSIKDDDAWKRISRNSDIFIDKYGRGSLIIKDYSALTQQDKEELELYAVINGLDIRRT